MGKCNWPDETCACYAMEAVKPDYAGRVWMHCEEGLNLSKSSMTRFVMFCLTNNVEIGAISPFNAKFPRSQVSASVRIRPSLFSAFEAETGGKLRPPPSFSLNTSSPGNSLNEAKEEANSENLPAELKDPVAVHVNMLAAANARADAAEAALAAQIEVDAGIAEDLNDYIWDYSTGNRGRIGSDPVAEAIRAQPHDRTALDRLIAKAEADALRRAAEKAKNRWAIRKEHAAALYEMDYPEALIDSKTVSAKGDEAESIADEILALIPKEGA